jgi:mannonate dehydratase
MAQFTRRRWIQGNLAMLAGAGSVLPAAAVSGVEGRNAPAADRGRIKLALMLPPDQQAGTLPLRWKLALQIGVRHAIVPVSGVLRRVPRDKYRETLAKLKADYAAAGLSISGVESHPVAAERIKLGLPGRDEQIANYCAAIEALGQAGIPMVCYNFMAGIGWYRTRVDLPERGGALTTGFDNRMAEKQGLTRWGKISEEKIWENLAYFLRRVIPVAEKAGVKMALHPDDPPVSPLRGIGRILISAAAYRRVFELVPSPVNGVTFCQANFRAMGEDIEAVAREFCRQGKVFFVHFRDIRGSGECFQETFHDNGPTNMPRMLQVYHDAGFDGPIRPDHAPTLVGESNQTPGYAAQAKILAIGYMRGILEARGIPAG